MSIGTNWLCVDILCEGADWIQFKKKKFSLRIWPMWPTRHKETANQSIKPNLPHAGPVLYRIGRLDRKFNIVTPLSVPVLPASHDTHLSYLCSGFPRHCCPADYINLPDWFRGPEWIPRIHPHTSVHGLGCPPRRAANSLQPSCQLTVVASTWPLPDTMQLLLSEAPTTHTEI